MNIKKHIPNFLTCLNLLSGSIAIVLVVRDHDFKNAAYLMWLAGLFDFLDGFIAKLLNVHSPLGKQLDSLADMITFGLLPSLMVFTMLAESYQNLVPYAAFVISIGSALRLAKFNLDTRQSDHFLGLATPANALFYSGLPWVIPYLEGQFHLDGNINLVILFFTFFFSWLMISEIPFIAFKFNGFGWAGNKTKYLYLLIALALLITIGFLAISPLIILYLVMSIATQKRGTNHS